MAILRGTSDRDIISSGSNADTLLGFAGNDSLFGNGGADQLRGGTGNDELFGAARTTDPDDGGKDNLSGGAGDDQLLGGLGVDLLTGGTDADRFNFEQRGPFDNPVYDTGVGKGNRDRITDFDAAEGDLINLLFVDDDVTDDVQGFFSFVGEIGSAGSTRASSDTSRPAATRSCAPIQTTARPPTSRSRSTKSASI